MMLPESNTAAELAIDPVDLYSMTHDNEHANNHDQNPTPEKKVVSPPSRMKELLAPSDPSAGPESADHLTTLAHDLSNLIDGSMRWLGIAASSIDAESPTPDEQLEDARQKIDTVQQTLHRMSTMVNVAMRSHTVPIGSPILGVSTAVSTAMAIDHAVDVVGPLASQAGVRIEIDIETDAGNIPAGPIYTVILNALFNSVQSIQRATKTDSLDPGGLIEILAKIDLKHDELVISVADDGVGLAPGSNPEQPFKHGHSSIEGVSGMGLSISHQIIEQLEGIITLSNRSEHQSSARPGAILTVRVPMPDINDIDPGERSIG